MNMLHWGRDRFRATVDDMLAGPVEPVTHQDLQHPGRGASLLHMENTDTITHIDIDRALAHPSECIACHRRVSRKSIDTGKATMVPVALDGTILAERTGQFYNLVIGPECRSKVGA